MSITDDMKIDHRLIGLTNLLSIGSNCSAGRQEMFSNHIQQCRPVIGAELPDVFSGFESLLADYTFNSASIENDVKVLAVVNKFNVGGYNPLRTVIYRDLTTGEISYFDVRRYSSYSNDYGYENVIKTHIQAGDILRPDMEIYSSPNKDGDVYKMGINANVAYMTLLETTEDLFPISESFAKRLSPLSVSTKSINVNLKRFPLNLYGNAEEFKIFPDIGEFVRPDGVLCAWRPSSKASMMFDLHPSRLNTVNHLFDQKVYAYPEAQVVDIDVYVNANENIPVHAYGQIMRYHEALLTYHQTVLDVYIKYKSMPISGKFNTLVTKAMGMLLAAKRHVPEFDKRPRIQLVDKFSPISLKIDITIAHRVVVNNGFKCTGRAGDKGVVVILPDEAMPVDEQGFRADICVDPVSVLKRTNIIQLYEQFINRLLKIEAMNLPSYGDDLSQYNRVMEVLSDINIEYAKVVMSVHDTPAKISAFVKECRENTIKICIPPAYDKLTTDMIEFLYEKYKVPISKVSFEINTPEGPKRITSKHPVMIGSKYIYLLAKYPKPIASGLGYVNHFHYPTHTSDKNGVPVGSNPIRFGEAESRMLATAVGTDQVVRLRGLYGNTKIGPERLLNALLDSQAPSAIPKAPIDTYELADNDFAVRIAHHMFNTVGIDFQNSIMSQQEASLVFEDLKNIK